GVVIADALGHLIMAGPGTGASPTSRRSRSSSRARRSTPRATITRQWFEEDAAGSILLNLEFEVAHASGAAATIVEVSAGAAAGDGSRENDPPLGASVP